MFNHDQVYGLVEPAHWSSLRAARCRPVKEDEAAHDASGRSHKLAGELAAAQGKQVASIHVRQPGYRWCVREHRQDAAVGTFLAWC